MLLFIALLLSGVLFLVAGLFMSRLTWRSDVAPYGRDTPFLQVALHPERFATAKRLGVIRLLNLLGGASLLSAVAVVLYRLAMDVRLFSSHL